MPEVRFAGFEGEWERKKLSGLSDFSKGQGYSKGDLVKTGTPIILYGRLYTKYETVIAKVDTFVQAKEQSVISRGNEVIVPASGESAEDISRAAVVEDKGIILGGDLNILSPNSSIDSVFLALTISNGEQQKELSRRAQGKSIVHIHNSDLQEVLLSYPELKEQNQISTVFRNLDNLITLQQRKYDKLVTVKKSMLEKMFPKDGASVPEIRFAGFTGAWERRTLTYYIEDYIEKTVVDNQHPVLTSSQKQGIVFQENYFADRQVTTNNNVGYFVLPRGFFTFRSRTDNGIFSFNRNDVVDKGIISYFYPVFKIINGDSDFFLQLLNSQISHQVDIAAEGTGQRVLSLKKFKAVNVIVPNTTEQQKIGALFTHLDTLITLHQQKLTKLKTIKKSLLDKMFA